MVPVAEAVRRAVRPVDAPTTMRWRRTREGSTASSLFLLSCGTRERPNDCVTSNTSCQALKDHLLALVDYDHSNSSEQSVQFV
jgi:hypothetical protein